LTPQQHAVIIALLTRIAEALERRPKRRTVSAKIKHAVDALLGRGEISAGISAKAAHALVLRELSIAPSDVPYGFKSAEGVRLTLRRKEPMKGVEAWI
jgi:hypothetical protein